MQLHPDKLQELSARDRRALAQALTPKTNKYIAHTPTPKQAAFLLIPHREALYGGAAGGGKALALDTFLPTLWGDKVMGDVCVGDLVLTENGEYTEVLATSEVMHGHDVYEVVFRDEHNVHQVRVKADSDHLWVIAPGCKVTTKDLAVGDTVPMSPNQRKYAPTGWYIQRITMVPSEPVKCIQVANPTGLFQLAGGVVTHNSDALLMGALQYVDVPGYAGIIFRKSFADLNKPGALIPRAKEWLSQFPEVQWQEKQNRFMFYDFEGRRKFERAVLQFGYLDKDSDRYNYQGGEYQFIGFDEITHFSQGNYLYLQSRLRRLKHIQIPSRVRAASNPPDDANGIWVYDRFVNPETRKPGSIFIPAGLNDNPYLDKEDYEQSLSVLDPVTRARLRDGNWEIRYKGNMFKREWFQFVDEAPPWMMETRFWDMAATATAPGKDPDWTVGARVGYHQGTYYIIDIERFRKRPQESQEVQQSVARADGYQVAIRMEQEPGSSGVIAIEHYSKNVFQGLNFKGIRSTGNKVLRASPFSALAEQGKVKIVKTCRNVDVMFDELESFPGAAHDDIVDAVSGGINELATAPKIMGQVPVIIGESTSYWSELSY